MNKLLYYLLFLIFACSCGRNEPDEDRLFEWVKENAVQPFERIEIRRPRKSDAKENDFKAEKIAFRKNGDHYDYEWPEVPSNASEGEKALANLFENRKKKYGFYDISNYLIDVGQHYPDALKNIHSQASKLGLEGNGRAYITVRRSKCFKGDRTKLFLTESPFLSAILLVQDKKGKLFDPEIIEADKKKVISEAWANEIQNAEILWTSTIGYCNREFSPLSSKYLIYVEGDAGILMESANLYMSIANRLINLNDQEVCGFISEKTALPEWVSLACKQRKISILEYKNKFAIPGLLLDVFAGTDLGTIYANNEAWIYSKSELDALFNKEYFDLLINDDSRVNIILSNKI